MMSGDGAAETLQASAKPPTLVTIGASAGGIKALQAFFDAILPNTGAAFVVVMHLDPQHRSQLAEILASYTAMPVMEVQASATLQPNHVYVIPPDRRLQVSNQQLYAVPFDDAPGKRTTIDAFFRSAAAGLGDGFAVILSGAGSDGALGIKAVKEGGGLILVQDPAEAEHDSMPRSAIATGVADFVLPVRELAHRLAELIALRVRGVMRPDMGFDEDLLRRVLVHLRVRTGHDFSKYKRSTVLRRVARRMQVSRCESLQQYVEVLQNSTEEAAALLGDLLISVTSFFRDAEAFRILATEILPKLFEGRAADDPIRVWVAGCASGEEAYSIAMLLLEESARHERRPPIQIFASDIDATALTAAREGWYGAAIEADMQEDRLRRFFQADNSGYRVRPELRDIILFAVHDLLKDPPFSRVDLISCRNLLIYLDRDLQEEVCSTFAYALKPGGYLMLGMSEAAESPPGNFRPLDRAARIYQSTARHGEHPRLLPRLLSPLPAREPLAPYGRMASPSSALSEAMRHRNAIERLGPPSMLVDEAYRVMHLSETAGRFITPSGGPLSSDVVDLVRQELRFELRSALHRAFSQREPSLSLPISVRFNGTANRVYLLVRPVLGESPHESLLALVMFIEGGFVDVGDVDLLQQQSADETVRRLTEELEQSQLRLRTMAEESETSNEELRAANEELQSINEEYRSTSEELETSREELQSINEELQTVNGELKLKLETISRAHNDLQNLMAATDIGTLFLDAGLRIKRFTQRVTELFSITTTDEGRPITDFAHQLEYDGLIKDARAVLQNLATLQREVRSRNGRWYDMRMRPYRTMDDRIDGVVITFVDMTERKNAEEALRESEQQLRQLKRLIEQSSAAIFVWQFDGGITEWNRGCEQMYGFSHSEAVGRRRGALLGLDETAFHQTQMALLKDVSWTGTLRHRAKDGGELMVEARLELVAFDGIRLVLETNREVAAQQG